MSEIPTCKYVSSVSSACATISCKRHKISSDTASYLR